MGAALLPRAASYLILGLLPGALAHAEEPSLETFLARVRAERAELLARLEPTASEVIQNLETRHEGLSPKQLRELRQAIVDLGSEAAPLWVAAIDPGDSPEPAASFRAEQVTQALTRLSIVSITAELIETLRAGSAGGRENAARILGHSSERDRIAPILAESFRAGEGKVRAACMKSLTRLGGPSTRQLIAEVLSGEDDEWIRRAIESLSNAPSEEAVELIRDLARSPRGSKHAVSIASFFAAHPDRVEKQDLATLVELATHSQLTTGQRIEVLEQFQAFPVTLSSDQRRPLEPLTQTINKNLREAALIALAIGGDRRARRDFLRPHNLSVDKNQNWAPTLMKRAEALYRVREYPAAIRDYKRALSVGKSSEVQPVYVGLARCYALEGKLKEAAEWLGQALMSSRELRELARDRDFARLAASRYGEVFGADG